MKMRMGVLLLIALLVYPAGSFGEDPAKATAKVETLEEIVVTATKTEEARKDIANAIVIIDAIDIEASAAESLGELLANEQGIDWRTRGDYGGANEEIHIRGMSASGTQILINGMTVNSPSLGSADAGRIPLHNIDKIEVVKGSGSLLYGTGATGGTVNIITKRPEQGMTDLIAGAGYGTHNTYEIFAEHGRFAFGDFGYYLTAATTDTDGFRDNGDGDRQEVTMNLVYEGADLFDISLYGDYIDRDYGQPGVAPPEGTAPFVVNGVTLYNDESSNLLSHGSDEDMHWVLNIKGQPSTKIDLNAKASYIDIESFNQTRYYSSWPAPGIPGSNTWVTNKIGTLEMSTDFRPMEPVELSFLVGGEYKHYRWENTTLNLDAAGNEIPASRTSTTEDLETVGLFIEGQYRPCDYAKLIAGVRREHHSEFGTEYVPRYGLIINPHESTAVKVNYGEHYNAPTPNDLFWPFEDWGFGMGAQGNADLQPETGEHMDITLEQSLLDNRLFINASVYMWDINDKIRWSPDANYFYRPENLDTYEGQGLEFGISFEPFQQLSMGVSYTYSDAEEELSGGVARQARYTADHYFKTDVRYVFDLGLSVTATARYTGDRPGFYTSDTDVDPQVELDAYWTADLKLEQRLFEHWILSIQGNNLFDEAYDTYVQSFRNQATGVTTLEGYPGAGRSVFFMVTYEY